MANNKIYSDYLMHYRTKGSRNGYSKDPNYTPIGQKARLNPEIVKNVTSAPARVAGTGSRVARAVSAGKIIGKAGSAPGQIIATALLQKKAYESTPEYSRNRQKGLQKMAEASGTGMGKVAGISFTEKKFGPIMRYNRFKQKQRERVKDFTGFMAKDIVDRAKTAAKKGRDFTDFVVEDNIDRGKKLVNKGKKKVKKLLSKLRG